MGSCYNQYANHLKRFKHTKETMRITIKDVAREAGVSIATASMALNNRAGVNAETRRRVLRIAREMHYVANHSAQALVMQESGCIGLMIPEIQNPFYSAIVDILSHLAEVRGYTLLLGIANTVPNRRKGTCVFSFRAAYRA